MTFPILYKKDTSGKVRSWEIKVEQNNDYYDIVKYQGQIGGKITRYAPKTIKVGKNIGKKNETTIYNQAFNEAQSQWTKKRDIDKMVENIAELTEASAVFKPMTAHKYNEKKKKGDKYVNNKHIKFPCIVQPKLDGVRCFAYLKDNKVIFMSRAGKEFYNLKEQREELLKSGLLDNGQILDGELYCHSLKKISRFNKIISACRKKENKPDKELDKVIELHVFDVFTMDNLKTHFIKRFGEFEKDFRKYEYRYIKLVETIIDIREIDIDDMHDSFVDWFGYEGLMLRNDESPYELNKRSKNLQKYKKFMDSEFVVVDANKGQGTQDGAVIWICDKRVNFKEVQDELNNGTYDINNGNTFKCSPKGLTIEECIEQYDNREEFIGKLLTVAYQELTEDSIPRFPKGVGFRDYE